MAKEHMSKEEFTLMKQQKDLQQEMEDLGVYGGHGVPTPTKKEIEKQRNFTDEERSVIYECLVENDNDVDEALVDYNKFSAGMEEGRLKPLTKQGLKSFRMRNIEEYCQHLATDIGLTAIIEIARDGRQEQTRSLAGQYLMNRGYGAPTQKIDMSVEHHTWADIEAEKEKTIKQLQESGTWYTPDDG